MSTRFVEEYDAWLKLRRKKLVDIYIGASGSSAAATRATSGHLRKTWSVHCPLKHEVRAGETERADTGGNPEPVLDGAVGPVFN